MKTNEFKKAVDELGFRIVVYEGFLGIETSLYNRIAYVSTTKIAEISNNNVAFGNLSDTDKHALFELMTAYASTPLDEREPERKWYLRDPITGQHLSIRKEDSYRRWNSFIDQPKWQITFTRAEIDAFTFPTEHLIEDEVKPDGR